MSDDLVEKIRKIVVFCDECGFASAFVTRDMLAEVADRLGSSADAKFTTRAEEPSAEVKRLTGILRLIYAGGSFADDDVCWEDLQQHSRSSGIVYGWNQAASKVAEAMGWERPIGPTK
ncbi:hypothetical protein FF100_05080 [Methylobacterium terricola]|uniref:Uncharacterized protein n=1 Tax=Methylobacterium terricola TaxID=2583531 RepID=A0A5C4LMY7_9HYPH|nr:hypothetical protein [Methylobacterium terricola]TNC14950.1 hypothetical protein FF100_05080 [Methylobacterium terricola]